MNEKVKKGVNKISEEIKEVPILKHFEPPKSFSHNLNPEQFIYCDPPEVILQSKQINIIKKIFHRCGKK
jgi:hypothetical protein